jgi:hypothetical protein
MAEWRRGRAPGAACFEGFEVEARRLQASAQFLEPAAAGGTRRRAGARKAA